jgi:glycosyltransferase involved in cell wall biosynthesis
MIKQNKIFKIALVGYQLSDGGLEKSMSSLSVFFGSMGIDVHNVVFVDKVIYPYSGKLLNIGKLKTENFGIQGKLRLLLYFRLYLIENKFDFIIDFRYRTNPLQELFFSMFTYNSKTIYTVFSSRLDTYLPSSKWLTNIICKNKYNVVCNANEIKDLLLQKYDLKNCTRIYSSIDFDAIKILAAEEIDINKPYIIAAGRFDSTNVKQFDNLIIAYSKSNLPSKGISLVLLGDGERQELLKSVAKEYDIEDFVLFLGFKNNPYKYFKNALFLVLCSKYEGFGIVLIESLACGKPVISFDCISGPKEIIVDQENGLLVENQNFEKLTDALNTFVEDEKLYENCKKNAFHSVSKFSIKEIGKQWLELMKIDIN